MQKILFVLLLLISANAYSSYVKGLVTEESGEPMPYTSVYVKNSTYGTATNIKGEYFLELDPGTYTIVFSFIGFESYEKQITVTNSNAIKLNVVMKKSAAMMKEVEIVANKRDRAKMVMDHVRDKRKYYLDMVENYKCKTYLKTTIEKELAKPEEVDSVKKDTINEKDIKTHFKKEKLNMIESISETNFMNPSKYKEVITAHHDYAEVKGEGGKTQSISINVGEEDIIPKDHFEDNPYILYKDVATSDFNFYKNLIDFPSISQQPLQSPIAAGSALNYSYSYAGSFYEGETKVHKIDVKPNFRTEALFTGTIYIADSTWALLTVDLSINKEALQLCRDFRIIQNYDLIDSLYYMPVRREINYTIRDGKYNIVGNTRVDHSDYYVNTDFPPKFFNDEVKIFDIYAFDKDSNFWNQERPITLKDNEIEFIHKTDSIKEYYTSDEYYHKVDSGFNKINGWFWLQGVGHRNRTRGTEWYVSGILEQINPFGVGGYRHKLPGYYQKEFTNHKIIETRGFIDYGVQNKDVKGKLSVGLTYIPLKFVKTTVTFGEYYEMINNYTSIEQTFSRSNYSRTRNFAIAQRMEIINGLFGELTFDFAGQNPINALDLNTDITQTSLEFLFPASKDSGNFTPVDFDLYTKAEFKLELKYRYKQKYLIKGGKKYLLGSKYPELRFIYRKCIPGIINSNVEFDYIELGAKDEVQLARFGASSWDVQFGTFSNTNYLPYPEHKFFRSSDRYFFSDPTRSFQLLEFKDSVTGRNTSINTENSFFRANYIHHFEGSILNKVPLFNRLRLSLAGGAGTLIMKDEGLKHVEIYGGIEKVFRIKQQLFRLSVFAVTADNTLDNANFTIKFGLNFYNSYMNKWE